MQAIAAVTFGSAATALHETSVLFVHKSEEKLPSPVDDGI